MTTEFAQKSARSSMALTILVVGLWAVFSLAAGARAGTDSQSYSANKARLQRMTREQRRQLWGKYQEFLALPPSEQDRLRRLQSELERLPSEKRDRYRAMMDRYKKWKDSLPLYQRQMLEDAATRGTDVLYATFRDVEERQKAEDKQRPYWLMPDRPGVRNAIPKILAKLSPEEIEQLDQAPPLDRAEKLFWHGQQLGLDTPALSGTNRPRIRGPLPPVDQEKLKEFVKRLPPQQWEELNDLGLKRAISERRLRELYYLRHPDELRERTKKGEGPKLPNDSSIRPRPKEQPEPDSKPKSATERPTPPGKLGIKPPES